MHLARQPLGTHMTRDAQEEPVGPVEVGAVGGLLCCVAPLVISLLVALVWMIATYNRFGRLAQHVKESWSGVDV
ncbi:MAG: hypothetical protein ACKOYN_12740, partial [Planctomycetota bacterium]